MYKWTCLEINNNEKGRLDTIGAPVPDVKKIKLSTKCRKTWKSTRPLVSHK